MDQQSSICGVSWANKFPGIMCAICNVFICLGIDSFRTRMNELNWTVFYFWA